MLAIGLPGAGKSTYFARKRIVPLSSDLIRELLYDNAADQRHPEWVFAALRELLRRRLAAGAQTTYIDATNLTRFFRRPFLQIAREFGCAAQALYFRRAAGSLPDTKPQAPECARRSSAGRAGRAGGRFAPDGTADRASHAGRRLLSYRRGADGIQKVA